MDGGGGTDRYSRSLGRIEAAASETAHIEGNGGATTAAWMNDTGISVCSANVATIGNQNNALSNMLKRPSDLLMDGVGYEKRVKLESNHQEDHKNGLIGIATKTDISAIMSGSPPRSGGGTAGATRVNTIVTKVDMSAAADNLGQMAWNGQLSRMTDARDPTSSASVETTHPVDPGHDVPSTSVVASHQQQQQTGVSAAPSINLPNLSSVNSLSGEPAGLSIGVLAPTGRNELSSAVAGATVGTTNTDNRGATGPPSAPLPPPPPAASLLDPFRQAFFGGTNLAALNAAAAAAAAAAGGGAGSTIGGADFGNLFFPGAPPNAAAAFPFLAAQILQQQQQTQQSMSLAQGTAPPTTLSAAAQPSTSTTSSMGCIQFPPGTALSSQLASAALLGRTLPIAGTQPLPMKAKQGRWCAMHIKIAYEILSKKERRSTPQPSIVAAAVSQSSSSSSVAPSSQNSNNAPTMRTGGVMAPFCPPSTSSSNMPSLGSGLPTSFPVLAQSGALSSPFTLPFQQLSDPNKLARQSATPKQSQGRSTTAISRSPTTSALHLQLGGGNTGSGAGGLMTPSMAVAAAAAVAAGGTIPPLQGSLPSALPGVLGSSLPLAPNLPGATASLTNGTSEVAAQAAMFAALQNAQQNAATAALPNGSLSSASYLLPSAAAASAQPHPLTAVTSQAQSVYSSQRLFDPNMAAVLQQMQSMEALRQSAAAAQMSSNAATGPHVPVSGAPQPPPPPPSSLDLVRMQMEQQMMDRYMVALSSASAIGSSTSMAPTSNLELMRQQLFAAQIRQQQSQPSLEALLEMQRQQHQQQQQQLYNASRGLPSTYTLTGATPPGGIPGPAAAAAMSSNAAAAAAAAAGLPQSLSAAAGLFNSNLMSLGNAAAAANLQQALYSGKNPYSNTLEQLARQKREEDIMQSGR
ncbi:unnamed protein product [Cercopithifilaria johnstoni]|uniref:Uncharacterized protein n=1 Tax=Cercopithifilaria johnstoni TaxID=2874296 RepID=A0A8J2Q6D4_9BILA|nr:unnamed protein product [Cercopithifilaria johnstoni]